jgi:AcrR family transcriptional regulator
MSKGDETRGRILDRAVATASLYGLDGMTIGGLAGDLEMSKSGLYAHFDSKEDLQVQVLHTAIERFRQLVVLPMLAAPRGVTRVRELFERWLGWAARAGMPGGCVITAAATELDDRPGRLRDVLSAALADWVDAMRRVVATAVEEGDFRRDLDVARFAYELYGIFLTYHMAHRMLDDPEAERHARAAFEGLVARSRP